MLGQPDSFESALAQLSADINAMTGRNPGQQQPAPQMPAAQPQQMQQPQEPPAPFVPMSIMDIIKMAPKPNPPKDTGQQNMAPPMPLGVPAPAQAQAQDPMAPMPPEPMQQAPAPQAMSLRDVAAPYIGRAQEAAPQMMPEDPEMQMPQHWDFQKRDRAGRFGKIDFKKLRQG